MADVSGEFYLAEGGAGAGWETRRGKVFASRTSCPTFRIFSSNDSRASFCRISGFIALAVIYCWFFLYLSSQGPGAFALDNILGSRRSP